MNIFDKLRQGLPKGYDACIEFGRGRITRLMEELTSQNEFNIVIFPKVENYHSVKLEDILPECRVIGSGVAKETDWNRREYRVSFIGEHEAIKTTIPIGLVSEKQEVMILLPKAEISIQGNTAVIKWHEIKRRKGLASLMLIQLTYL